MINYCASNKPADSKPCPYTPGTVSEIKKDVIKEVTDLNSYNVLQNMRAEDCIFIVHDGKTYRASIEDIISNREIFTAFIESIDGHFDVYKGNMARKIDLVETTLNARIDTIIANATTTEGNSELIDIRTSSNGKVYASAGDSVRAAQADITQLSKLAFVWDIGHTLSSTGEYTTASVGAVCDEIHVDGGNFIKRNTPTTDNNSKTLIIHICEYKNGVFVSRTSLGAAGLTLASDTTSIRINFSRSASTGIQMTQNDIATYFSIEMVRNCVAIADYNSDIKSVFRSLRITQDEATSLYGGVCSNLPPMSSVWTAKSWWSDLPSDISNYVYVLSFSNDKNMNTQGTQIIIDADRSVQYTRRLKSSVWTDWVCNSDKTETCKLYSFGDSLTWGAVWDSDETTALYQAGVNCQIPTRIGKAIGATAVVNNGVSGARFVKQGDSDTSTIIGTVIKTANLSDAQIVTIGGGRNDSATALGDGNTATANDGTICGALVDIFEHLTSTYPKLHIVMYGVTPQPTVTAHAPSDIYTRVFAGGWSLNTYYAEMSKLCKRYGVQFIDWYDCPLILRWGVLSGGYSSGSRNWSHPISEDIYKQMGNYLAGKITFKGN